MIPKRTRNVERGIQEAEAGKANGGMDCGNMFPLWLHDEQTRERRVSGRCNKSGVVPPQSTSVLRRARYF